MAIETIFRALGDQNRVRIVILLGKKDFTVDQLSSRTGLSQSSTSQHLKILLQAGLVSYSKLGNFRLYGLQTEELMKAMRFFDRLWDDSLKKLKVKLENRNE